MPTPIRIVSALFLAATSTLASQARSESSALQDEAVRRITEYLRINTTNPPGNEAEAMRFFARIFKDEGIAFDTASSAPGRGNIWARLKGGSAPALVLLHHMDVVPADTHYWHADPFGGTVRNGDLLGRGALDTKTLGIVQLEAFVALHRRHAPLTRDVIFMATADEEAGGAFGAGWVVKHHPEAFAGAGFVLNEGGDGTVEDGRARFGIEVTQKVPLWLRLVATDRPSHGSIPPVTSSVNRLVRALFRIQTHDFAPRIVPAVDAYFKGLAPSAAPQWRDAYGDIGGAVQDRNTLLRLQIDAPAMAALTRNTCSITMLAGSNKINVIPPEAQAQVDCRLLPDQDRPAFLAELASVIDDPGIRIEQIMGFTAAVSPLDNPLYRAIADVTRKHFPAASIVPQVSTGFTDSHFFRDLGLASYGYAPFLIPADQEGGVHGNDERISLENVRRGTVMMLEIVEAMTRP
ncbi:MAG TPA: M20/M25/M40 family metallo-hydrolase [Gemmatimonadales bacterium]|nr:M20/M25/M40 family metallo-hydrolase [Gemmatimonadales bacterium]